MVLTSAKLAAVRHGHASLRFDADPKPVAAYLARVILSGQVRVLTTTEGRSSALADAVRDALPDTYRVVRRNEYLIVWHGPTYRPHALAGLALLDPRSWPMLSGHRWFRVARKRFTHRATGTTIRVDVTHVPSGIASGPGEWSRLNPDRVDIARSGLERMGRNLRRFRRRHPRGLVFVHMDSNLDQFRPVWRDYLTTVLGLPSVWDLDRLPDSGSHGHRLIDTAHMADVPILSSHVVVDLSKPAGLDHRPITYRFAYPAHVS